MSAFVSPTSWRFCLFFLVIFIHIDSIGAESSSSEREKQRKLEKCFAIIQVLAEGEKVLLGILGDALQDAGEEPYGSLLSILSRKKQGTATKEDQEDFDTHSKFIVENVENILGPDATVKIDSTSGGVYLSLKADSLLTHGKELANLPYWLNNIVIKDATNEKIIEMMKNPEFEPLLSRLKILEIKGTVDDVGAQAISQCPHLKNLTKLNTSDTQIGENGRQALFSSPHLKRINSVIVIFP